MIRRAASILALVAFAVSALAISRGAAQPHTVTLVFQQGVDGYTGAGDDGRDGAVKLMDDRKSADPRYPNPDYRHVLRFTDLGQPLGGVKARVVSAALSLRYFDEWWSVNVYHIAVHRSTDGSADGAAQEADDTQEVWGDRFPDGQKTPRPSWVTWKLRPATVQAWLDDPSSNHGLVLRVARRDFSRGDEGNYGIHFRGCRFGIPVERPKLTVTLQVDGNLPPRAPVWADRYRDTTVGSTRVLRWHPATPADPDGDAVAYDVEVGLQRTGQAVTWRPVTRGASGDSFTWRTADLPDGAECRLRIRARDAHGAESPWVEADGPFRATRAEVAYQLGFAGPMDKVRRDTPFDGELGSTLAIELARNEYEGAQVVVAGVERDLRGLTVEVSDLRSTAGVLPRACVTIRQVGYVNTVETVRYSAPYAGLWPDPLLELSQVDVPAGKVQPLWVTVHAPKDAAAGAYRGTLTLKAANAPPRVVELRVTVWPFTLPTPGRFRAMAIDGGTSRAFLDRLLANRLSPAYAMCGWSWDKPCPPAALKDGAWDFSEADRVAEYCLPRGMNAFTMARFAKPGKFGFPATYSPDFRTRFGVFLTAYAAHLRQKGWLAMGHVYNIDEPPAGMWETCKENYRAVKAAARDVQVLQCLNEPKGVAALAGFADVWDVYIGQFLQGGAPARMRAGDDAIWAICCYPSTHPNLFVDYAAIDARIVGWLSWKAGVSGFEYWSVNSWGDNPKRLGPSGCLERIETGWKANTFGDYNGDGYLTYPGPGGSVLSSIRLENLRDGIEDYEMLALLRDRAARATGPAAVRARRLLDLEGVCQADLTYAADPKPLLATRRRIAECLAELAK